MLTEEEQRAASEFLDDWEQAMRDDAKAKGINFPTPDKFRKEVTDHYVRLYGPAYIRFLVVGRGPGKMPPVGSIEASNRKYGRKGRDSKTGRYITDRSLAWKMAKSIALRGTLIFQKKKPGIDEKGAIASGMGKLMRAIARNEAATIMTGLIQSFKAA